MNGPTITMGPTMANPEAFTTVAELRQELHRANNQLLESTERLHVLSTALSHLAKTIGELLQLHSDGESDARIT